MAEEQHDGSAQTFHIDGSRIDAIGDLYTQINALLMADEDWQIGTSLDALNDVLYRVDPGPAVFVWTHHAHSRESLGVDATRGWLEEKLSRPGTFDEKTIRAQLDALLAGEGQTYFEIVLDVFAGHPGIRLDLR